jgi:transcriptional regulator with XRE-family HTH domain
MERLAGLRRRRLLTQRELANQLGLTVQAIQKWEAGTALPRTASLRRLCEILEVPLEELLTEDEQRRVFTGRRGGAGDQEGNAAA